MDSRENTTVTTPQAAAVVTVVVPVFNVERWLSECIASVEAQTFTRWKMILVDDGSTDSSGKICDEAAARNPRISVIHQRNGGPSAARNAALDLVDTPYLSFIDSDDVVHPRYLEVLFDALIKTGADISLARHVSGKNFYPGFYTSEISGKIQTLSGIQATEKILFRTSYLNHSPCGRIYRMEIWRDTRFMQGIIYEDLEIAADVFPKASVIAAVPDKLYYYRSNPDSIVHNTLKHPYDAIFAARKCREKIEKTLPDLVKAADDILFSTACNILGRLSVVNQEDSPLGEECLEIINSLRFQTLFNPKVRLKSKAGALLAILAGKKHLPGAMRRLKKFISHV